MKNKRWTPQTEITETLLKSREKRKWQIALRRYVVEKNRSSFYAPYFGIGIDLFRQWIELQFDEELNWQNFGEKWRLDHIIPISYFDFENEEDMKLCWNFINIQVERTLDESGKRKGVDIIAARRHFEKLFTRTGFELINRMIIKINALELLYVVDDESIIEFLDTNNSNLNTVSSFSAYEFDQLNSGITIAEVVAEREVLKKFGG
jgi:hypothetical protein